MAKNRSHIDQVLVESLTQGQVADLFQDGLREINAGILSYPEWMDAEDYDLSSPCNLQDFLPSDSTGFRPVNQNTHRASVSKAPVFRSLAHPQKEVAVILRMASRSVTPRKNCSLPIREASKSKRLNKVFTLCLVIVAAAADMCALIICRETLSFDANFDVSQ